MINRREILKGVTLGAGATALSPFLRHLHAADANQTLPRRFVFVVKSSGLQPEFLNPEGLKHGGSELVDERLSGRILPTELQPLARYQDRMTIIQGLSGKMCTSGHSGFYGALGAYKASSTSPPAYPTIDGYLANQFPSVFNHVGLKMGNGSQGTAYPSISASGKNLQLPFQCDPQLAYQNLFGSISTGNVKRKFIRSGNVLDTVAEDVKKLQKSLPGHEREKLGHYLHGFEALRDRRLKLIDMQHTLQEHAPELVDKYESSTTTHHLEAHFDMAAAALISGITNVVTIHCDDLEGSYKGLGITPKVHAIGHGSSSGSMSSQDCRNLIRKFHLELISIMAGKLEATPEGDATMLDNTLIVYVSDNAEKHHSSATEWPIVTIGNLGGRMDNKGGRYLAYPRYGSGKHKHTVGNWLTTITHLAGKPVDHFGQPDFALGRLEDQKGPLQELLA